MAAAEKRLSALVCAEPGVSRRGRPPPSEGGATALGLEYGARSLAHVCSAAAQFSAGSGLGAPAVAGDSRVHGPPARERFFGRLLAWSWSLQVSNRIAAGAGAASDPRQKRQKRASEGLRSGCAGAGGIIGSYLRLVSLHRLSKISVASAGAVVRRCDSPGYGEPPRIDLFPLSQRPIYLGRRRRDHPVSLRADQDAYHLETGASRVLSKPEFFKPGRVL